MFQGEHSAILSTCIKLPFVINIFVLLIFEWPLKTGFTVYCMMSNRLSMYLEWQPLYFHFSQNVNISTLSIYLEF